MKRLGIALGLLALLATPTFGGVKKYPVPIIGASGSPSTSTNRITYVCDTLAELNALTGNTGDYGIVTAGGTATLYVWNGGGWFAPDGRSNAIFQQSIEFFGKSGTAQDLTEWEIDTDAGGAYASTTKIADPGGHPGILACGSTVNTRGGWVTLSRHAGQPTLKAGAGQIYFEALVRIPALSDATNSFVVRLGLADGIDGGTINLSNGWDFYYNHGTNSGKWQCRNRNNNGTITANDSGITVTANRWYKLAILVNAAATSVNFYIDGSLVKTETAAMSVNPITAGFMYQPSASDATDRWAECDYIKVVETLTTAR